MFSYKEAFSRNIGLLTEEEQNRLKNFRIAIPGMGGVGGSHLITLVRQGFEKFNIADYDSFDIYNFNRQYGATIDTIEKPKIEIMKDRALEINPNCKFRIFEKGISKDNLEDFLEKVDLAIDGIDAFEIDIRRDFLNKAHSTGIPVISAGPLGFSTAYLIFLPGGPSFDEHLGINEGSSYSQKLASFFVALAPKLLQRKYMKGVNLKEKRGPSSIASINLCSGIVGVNALKILLKKGKVKAVPYYHQFDAMMNKYVCRKVLFGNKNPFQKMKIKLVIEMIEGKRASF